MSSFDDYIDYLKDSADAAADEADELNDIRKKLGKLHDYANMRDAQVVDLQAALEGVLNSMMTAKGTEMDPVLGPTYYCYGIHLDKAHDLLKRLKGGTPNPA